MSDAVVVDFEGFLGMLQKVFNLLDEVEDAIELQLTPLWNLPTLLLGPERRE